jgi:beta-glucuronidase
VYLEFTDSCYIDDMTVYTKAYGYLKTSIDTVCDRVFDLRIELLDKEMKKVVLEEYIRNVKPGRYVYEKKVDGVKPWNPEEPNLYILVVEIVIDGVLRDSIYERIGFRDIEIKNGKIYLNGKPVFLKGFGRHEDFPVTGKYLPGAVLIRDFYLMKKIGANSFRTSH